MSDRHAALRARLELAAMAAWDTWVYTTDGTSWRVADAVREAIAALAPDDEPCPNCEHAVRVEQDNTVLRQLLGAASQAAGIKAANLLPADRAAAAPAPMERRDDPESRKYWASVDKIAAEAKSLPAYLKGGPSKRAAAPAPEGLDAMAPCVCGHVFDLHVGHTQAWPITAVDTHCSQGCGCDHFRPALRAHPALSDEALREMAETVAYRVRGGDYDHKYEQWQFAMSTDAATDALMAFARAVLAKQEGQR